MSFIKSSCSVWSEIFSYGELPQMRFMDLVVKNYPDYFGVMAV